MLLLYPINVINFGFMKGLKIPQFSTVILILLVSKGLSAFGMGEPHDYLAPVGEACARLLTERVIKKDAFTANRTLLDYLAVLGPEFREILKRLKAGDHWIDGGAGKAQAAQDFQRPYLDTGEQESHSSELPYVTAISYVDPAEGRLDPVYLDSVEGHFRGLFGRFFEDILYEEIVTGEFKKAKLITDYFGILAYSARLDVALQKYVDLLADDGDIFIYYGYIGESWSPAFRGTQIQTHSQGDLDFEAWVRKVEGLEVTRLEHSSYVSLRIRKIPGVRVRIPGLELIDVIDTTTPPIRLFREVN